ncbi:AtpZ/AtpI family protein [Candidatus Omnitrophota bacterium]
MKKYDLAYYVGLVTQLGLTIIFSIIAGLLIGLFLDKMLNTKGVFLVFFLGIGIVGGFYKSYQQIMKK